MLALKDQITGSQSNSEGKHNIRAHFKYNYAKHSAKLHSSVYVLDVICPTETDQISTVLNYIQNLFCTEYMSWIYSCLLIKFYIISVW